MGTSRCRRAPSRSRSRSRSYATCRFSQNRSDVPKNRAKRSAVSALTPRVPCTISLMRRRHRQALGRPVLRQLQWHEKLLEKNLAGMDRRQALASCHSTLLVIIDHLDVMGVAILPGETQSPLVVDANAPVPSVKVSLRPVSLTGKLTIPVQCLALPRIPSQARGL